MPFDLSSAKPVSSGFDLSTAHPIGVPISGPDAIPTPRRAAPAAPAAPAAATSSGAFETVGGVVEPVLTTLSGLAGGLVGSVAGAGRTIIGGNLGTQEGIRQGDEFGGKVAEALTYQPRSETGRRVIQAGGQALQDSGIVGIPIPELNSLGRGAAAANTSLRALAAPGAEALASQDAALIASGGGGNLRDLARAPTQLNGVGAARATEAAQRAERAAALPVPIKLTKGQLTRDREQVAFERETAKQKEGAPLASNYENQNAQFAQNLDAGVDATGAQSITKPAVGKSVVDALEAKSAAKQTEIRDLYQQARAAGEMQQPVDVTALTNWVEKNKGKDKLAPIVSTIESELKQNARTEGGGLDNLTLTQRPTRTMMTLDASEDLRQAINKLAEPGTPNVVYGKEAKGLIDAAQEGKGGDLFKSARRAYENYSNEFTNRDVVDRLLRVKPGTKDRAVALEDVADKSIIGAGASTADVKHLFRVLEAYPAGSDPAVVAAGQQAARDLRGSVITHIKEEMQKNLNVDSTGARTGSPAKINSIVSELDKDGKLEAIFGKADAQKIRDLRDAAIDIYTSPSGTVNSSNTSSAILRKLGSIGGYSRAVPGLGKIIDYSAGKLEEVRTRAKVKEALNPKLSDLGGD